MLTPILLFPPGLDRSYASFEHQVSTLLRKALLASLEYPISFISKKALRLDSIIIALPMKGQSLHHIYINHADEIMLDERRLCNYVYKGISTARNIDMPRVVRISRRKKEKRWAQDARKMPNKPNLSRLPTTIHKFFTSSNKN